MGDDCRCGSYSLVTLGLRRRPNDVAVMSTGISVHLSTRTSLPPSQAVLLTTKSTKGFSFALFCLCVGPTIAYGVTKLYESRDYIAMHVRSEPGVPKVCDDAIQTGQSSGSPRMIHTTQVINDSSRDDAINSGNCPFYVL